MEAKQLADRCTCVDRERIDKVKNIKTILRASLAFAVVSSLIFPPPVIEAASAADTAYHGDEITLDDIRREFRLPTVDDDALRTLLKREDPDDPDATLEDRAIAAIRQARLLACLEEDAFSEALKEMAGIVYEEATLGLAISIMSAALIRAGYVKPAILLAAYTLWTVAQLFSLAGKIEEIRLDRAVRVYMELRPSLGHRLAWVAARGHAVGIQDFEEYEDMLKWLAEYKWAVYDLGGAANLAEKVLDEAGGPIRDVVRDFYRYATGIDVATCTDDEFAVVVVNRGPKPMYEVQLVDARWLGEDRKTTPVYIPSGSSREVNLAEYELKADDIDRLEFTVMGVSDVKVPFEPGDALARFHLSFVSPHGKWQYAPATLRLDPSICLMREGVTVEEYRWRVTNLTSTHDTFFVKTDDEPVEHVLHQPGRYRLELTLLVDDEEVSSNTRDTFVWHPVSVTVVAQPEPAYLFDEIHIDARGSTSAVGDIVSWSWDFGDGDTRPAGQAQETHRYAASGEYRVSVTATNEDGYERTEWLTLDVRHPLQVDLRIGHEERQHVVVEPCKWSWQYTLDASGSTFVDPETRDYTSLSEAAFTWHLGDGHVVEGKSTLAHVYTERRQVYTVSLIVSHQGYSLQVQDILLAHSMDVFWWGVDAAWERGLCDPSVDTAPVHIYDFFTVGEDAVWATALAKPGIDTIAMHICDFFVIGEDAVWERALAEPIVEQTLTIDSTMGGEVTVPGEGAFTYEAGTVVDLVAVADEHYQFVEWTGDVDEIADLASPETTVTMWGDYSISANLELIPTYELFMEADPVEGGMAIDLTDESPYLEGAEVSIEAVAEPGYSFIQWTAPAGAFEDASAPVTVFIMPAQNATVIAQFELVPREAIEALICQVESLDLDRGIEDSLVGILNAAISSLDRGRPVASTNQLRALINQVDALRGKKISDAVASDLINKARDIISAM